MTLAAKQPIQKNQGVESLWGRQLATPVANLEQNVLLWFPFNHISKAERVILTMGRPRIAFTNLTKAFGLVSSSGLFTLVQRIGFPFPPSRLLNMIITFHKDLQGTVQYNGSSSYDTFPLKSRVKKCVLALTLFGISLVSYIFNQSEDSVYLHTRSDGGMFNLVCLHVKIRVWKVVLKELLFADDAALAAHTEVAL